MILIWLLIIPFAGGIVSWALSRLGGKWPRWISLLSLTGQFIIAGMLWWYLDGAGIVNEGDWLVEVQAEWLPLLGISFHVAVDGISILLLALTSFMGIMAVLASWTEIEDRVGFFHVNLLCSIAGITGVFIAVDLFLFYFFWELMLVPMYFLIALWGHEGRTYAAIKFFVFTQLGGLFMILTILGLVFLNAANTGIFSFDYADLLDTSMDPRMAMVLFSGFLAAFLVKLPAVPLHTWLPDAHTEAPTAGSMILAGLLLKTGAYGMIRFAVPLFPDAAARFAPAGMVIALAGIIYGAVLAFAQTDLKRLIAYTSISHMGFVLLGISAWNAMALQGVMIQIICHGVSTGALFMLAGALQERVHTRALDRMGGLWSEAPRMGGVWLFFGLASLGLPGLGNFMGEFLVLLGTYDKSIAAAAIAAAGFIAATIYALWMVWKTFLGPQKEAWNIPDLSTREMVPLAVMIAVIVWIGLFPQILINAAGHGINNLGQTQNAVAAMRGDARCNTAFAPIGCGNYGLTSRVGGPPRALIPGNPEGGHDGRL